MEIKIADIQIPPDRQRQEESEEALAELVESIKNNGLINPIVIGRDNRLVTGGRRIKAYLRLGRETIEARYFESLDPLERKIVEFDENDKRKQLTWQEAARAIKEIHDLKREKEGRGWTASDTARALGVSLGKVSEDLTLAAALDNPRITSRPTRRGALSTVKRERELILVRELARRRATGLGIAVEAASTSLTGGVVYNSDCRVILDNINENSIDLIIIDPPWGIGLDKASQWSSKWIASYDDSQDAVYKMMVEVAVKLFRILKPTCHFYSFYPIQESEWWVNVFTKAGFIVRQRPLIWFKTGQPSITDVYTSFLPCYESIIWGFKAGDGGTRRLFSHPVPEAQGWSRQAGLWHENEKPVEMIERWIESSSEPNEIVLDCFSGGASTLAAAFNLGRYYIGIELDEVNYKKGVERMKALEERKEEVQEDE